MSKWEKLLFRILSLSRDIRFEELRKVLESYGYAMHTPRGGSSHHVFRKEGEDPIVIPKHTPIKIVYVKQVKEVIEKEENRRENR